MVEMNFDKMMLLVVAREQSTLLKIRLWMIASEAPKPLQASERRLVVRQRNMDGPRRILPNWPMLALICGNRGYT